MRHHILTLVVILFSCNSSKQERKQKETNAAEVDKCFVYPSIVDSLQLKELYDSARWYIYTFQCDEIYLPKSDTTISIPFGELPLEFDTLVIRHDTLDVIFSFMDKQQPILFSMNRNHKGLVTGIGFNIKTKSKLYMIFPGGNVTYKGGFNRFENPMQPEVTKYIKEKWDKIDDCFRELAISSGIKP